MHCHIPYASRMEKNRLEAFSDGVLAIIIAIMVLEMKVPHGSDWAALKPVLPPFLSYLRSITPSRLRRRSCGHGLPVASAFSSLMWLIPNRRIARVAQRGVPVHGFPDDSWRIRATFGIDFPRSRLFYSS
jgi:hypothetical protein